MSSLYVPYMPRPGRPIGIIILTILQIIIGIGDIIIGIVLLILVLIAGVLVGDPLATALFLIDFVVIGLGIFSLVLAYGLWTGKRWAWTISVIEAIIGISLGVLVIVVNLAEGKGILESLSSSPREPLVPIIVYALILGLLMTTSVRTFFGGIVGVSLAYRTIPALIGQPHVPPTQSPYPLPTNQQPYYPKPGAYFEPTSWGPFVCPSCGSTNPPIAKFCDRCGTRLR